MKDEDFILTRKEFSEENKFKLFRCKGVVIKSQNE